MVRASNLKIGQVYFGLSYEDEGFSHPIVNSYEYLGVDIDGPPKAPEGTEYFFRFVGTKDLLQIKEQQIPHVIMDVPGVTEELKKWAETRKAPEVK